MLKLDFDTRGIDASLDKITKAANAGVRPAAQAGAQVLYERARAEAPKSSAAHNFHIEGRVYGPFSPGTLRDSIYQVFSKSRSSYGQATYHISFNHTKAPYGYMVLRGTSRLPANDFIGRAYDSGMQEAAKSALERLKFEVKKVL